MAGQRRNRRLLRALHRRGKPTRTQRRERRLAEDSIYRLGGKGTPDEIMVSLLDEDGKEIASLDSMPVRFGPAKGDKITNDEAIVWPTHHGPAVMVCGFALKKHGQLLATGPFVCTCMLSDGVSLNVAKGDLEVSVDQIVPSVIDKLIAEYNTHVHETLDKAIARGFIDTASDEWLDLIAKSTHGTSR